MKPFRVLFVLFAAVAAAQAVADEVWVTAQDAHEVKVIRGCEAAATILLPSGSGPHSVDFSPNGRFAYVANVGNGDMVTIDAERRQIVSTIDLGAAGTHQARPSPDGATILVAQIPSRTLIKLRANPTTGEVTETGRLTLNNSPVCTEFRKDGLRAYVSLAPSGIQVVDVATMQAVGQPFPTDGAVQCGFASTRDGATIWVVSNGGNGRLYRIDTANNQLTESNDDLAGSDLHGVGLIADDRFALAASRGTDSLQIIRLRRADDRPIILPLDPSAIADRPDMVAMSERTAYVTLRATGKLGVVTFPRGGVDIRYVDVASPSPNAAHGVAVRPGVTAPACSR